MIIPMALVSWCVAAPPQLLEVAKERRMHPTSVTASGYLWNDWNRFQENYHPNYIADDDAKTAWVEGAAGNGEGESVVMNVAAVGDVAQVRLRIQNGYQKSTGLFQQNGRASTLTVTLLPSKTATTVALTDTMGLQEFKVAQPKGPLTGVQLTIVNVVAGTKYADTCISGVELHVSTTTPENPAFEKSNFETLKTWRKERIAAAKAFAGNTKDMLVGDRYTFTSAVAPAKDDRGYAQRGVEGAAAAAELAAGDAGARAIELKSIAAQLRNFDALVPVDITVRQPLPWPALDGFSTSPLAGDGQLGVRMPDSQALLDAARFSVFALKKGGSVSDFLVSHECKSERLRDRDWALLSTSADSKQVVKMIVTASCALVCGRDGLQPETSVRVLVYDAKGALAAYVEPTAVELVTWGTTGEGGRPIIVAVDHIVPYANVYSGRLTYSGAVSVR